MEISKIEVRKTIEKTIKTKSWFFEKINKFDKPLARLTKKKKKKLKLPKSGMKERTLLPTKLTEF